MYCVLIMKNQPAMTISDRQDVLSTWIADIKPNDFDYVSTIYQCYLISVKECNKKYLKVRKNGNEICIDSVIIADRKILPERC